MLCIIQATNYLPRLTNYQQNYLIDYLIRALVSLQCWGSDGFFNNFDNQNYHFDQMFHHHHLFLLLFGTVCQCLAVAEVLKWRYENDFLQATNSKITVINRIPSMNVTVVIIFKWYTDKITAIWWLNKLIFKHFYKGTECTKQIVPLFKLYP